MRFFKFRRFILLIEINEEYASEAGKKYRRRPIVAWSRGKWFWPFTKEWRELSSGPAPKRATTMSQEQVTKAFGYKWTHDKEWGMSGNTAEVMQEWLQDLLGFATAEDYAAYFRQFPRILDAGCGNGRDVKRIAQLCTQHTVVVGLDISDAIDVALENTRGMGNVSFTRGDILNNDLPEAWFDCIYSNGVLHHTPSTREALASLVRLLKPGGEVMFTIYRKKGPIREFADDLVREAIQHLTPEQAWKEMEGITHLGKALSDLNAEIEIPEIKTLGIDGGKHNVQRLIYYTMLKCYWRDSFTFQENVHVNYDWYYPKFAWRHTKEEVREWFKELNLEETFFREIPATLSFRAKKNL
jgi:arsenite methyltransferase